MQTDPTFDTLEALEAWIDAMMTLRTSGWRQNYWIGVKAPQIARVRAAHSHLLKGNDDE